MSCNNTWPAKDGEISIHEMTDTHLNNAINYCDRIISNSIFGFKPSSGSSVAEYWSYDDVPETLENKMNVLLAERERRDSHRNA